MVKGVAGEKVDLLQLFRNILPFIYIDILTLATLMAVPQIVLLLPSTMK